MKHLRLYNCKIWEVARVVKLIEEQGEGCEVWVDKARAIEFWVEEDEASNAKER